MVDLTCIAVDGVAYQMALPHKDVDYIQGKIAKERCPYEPEMLQNMASRLTEGQLVLDVGANIGNHTLYLAAVKRCRVMSFEPNKQLCSALKESVVANGMDERVKVYSVGVGKQHAVARFSSRNQENLGAQYIEVVEGVAADIEVIALDELAVSDAVSMIKIDVEGMELDVLLGASKLIERDLPDIYVECQTFDEYKKISSYMESLGYIYLDTFNATPTHLFVNKSAVDLCKRGEQLAHKVLSQEYQLKPELVSTKKSLHQCNIKYRGASAAINTLKEKLEASRMQCEQDAERLESARKEFEYARERWSMEQQELERTIREKETELKAREEWYTELKLAQEKLEAEHDQVLQRVEGVMNVSDHSHAGHIALIDQIDTLRNFLNQERLARQENWHWLKERQEVAEENQTLKQQLEKANQKYREATASQIPALKQKVELQAERMRDLQRRAEQLNQEVKLAKQQRTDALRALSNIKASLSYKAGLHLRAASHSLADAVKLPVRLWRLRRLANQKPFPQASQVSQRSNNDAVNPVSATGKAPSVLAEPLNVRQLHTEVLAEKPAKQIRVACIMDDFTFGSYQPECDLHQLTPEHWAAELEACQPELLFIESAWRGKDELWGSKVGHTSQELQGIMDWCRERNIPTIFWNKEDPVHFETFLNTARLFDFVFTTDLDCIHRYKAALGHERVYFLPFACQPTLHNPVEKYQRKDAFCFAGAYYVRYPERTRDLKSFVEELPSFRPLEIYDRNYGKSDPNYQFPEAYQPHIVGTLPFEQIDKAYKGYRYAINLNSIKQSQTMFARRVYELLGSNTLTVSNFSRGVRLMFGDLVITSDSGSEVKRRLEVLEGEGKTERLRLAGVRKAMLEHTYTERLAYVLSKVSSTERAVPLPSFKVLATARTEADIKQLVENVSRQSGVEVSLTIFVRRGLSMKLAEDLVASSTCQVALQPAKELRRKSLRHLADEATWIAGMAAQDYYGRHYLLDIALATRYSEAQVIGKAAHHAWEGEACTLHHADNVYRPANHLAARRSAIASTVADTVPADKWLAGLASWQYSIPGQLAIDAFSYCENGMHVGEEAVAQAVDDLAINPGVSLRQLAELAESMPAMQNHSGEIPYLDGPALASLLTGKPYSFHTSQQPREEDYQEGPVRLSRNKAISATLSGSVLEVSSELPDGKHEYIYASKELECGALFESAVGADNGTLPLHMEVEPGLNLSLVVLFLDENKKRISHVIEQPNRNQDIELPEGTAFIRLGLRIYAGGSARIKRLLLGHLDLEPASILGQSDVLLLTNHYPSYNDLYRNGFVHSRVKAYKERGVNVDVFRLRKDQPISWHEFQDTDVTTGSQEALRRMLASGRYRHVLVHFLDPDMWEVLKDFIDTIKVTVWLHGAEIHPWYRRKFNIETPEQETNERAKSEVRMAFWKGLLSPMPKNLHMVFVSKIFSEEVMEDLGFLLPENQYSIIHNPINTELFDYVKKPAEQRKKILSIRPFSSRQYANDISVKVILELSKLEFFEDLEFRVIGDGKLFDETVDPLRKFSNVILERRFLTQGEIAALHKEYGIFMCPTRWDSQGVSRDEAMASGLIPVTNTVAAVSEFASTDVAILANPESTHQLADGIKHLYQNPELFGSMSASAHQVVKRSRDLRIIIKKELSIFCETT